MIDYIGAFRGMKVIADVNMTEPAPSVYVLRSWRERLFSWPWRPWVEGRWMPQTRPSRQIYQIGLNTLVMHPAMFNSVKSVLGEKG